MGMDCNLKKLGHLDQVLSLYYRIHGFPWVPGAIFLRLLLNKMFHRRALDTSFSYTAISINVVV